MDHEATREAMELAAVEPGGLERLMAGDTAAAQAVAAHLAGCPSCADEASRLQRAATLIRSTVRSLPPPELKERTLAAIRAEGVQRPLSGVIGAPQPAAGPSVPALPDPGPGPAIPAGAPARGRRLVPVLGWAASVAAAVVLSVIATWLLIGARVDGQLASQAESIAALEEVTTATLTVTSQPDALHIALAGVADQKLAGSLAYSPSTAELVVVATGLTPPAQGLEFRCWVEVNGVRHRVGKMFFSKDLAYWVGPAPAVAGLASGATFGVSLVGVSGPAIDTAPVLLGRL
ncbi:MAG: hypothetical protein QOI37_471 [Chloroflexota bacterium]|nr:hypothetical protein [Chloroflexota bacterium]